MNTAAAQTRTQRTLPSLLRGLAFVCLIVPLALSAHAAVDTRTSSFDYDPATGLLRKEIILPGDSNLCLVTEYEYDDYGNRKSVTTRNCNGSAGEAAAPAAGSNAVIERRTDTSTYTYNADNTVTVVVTNAISQKETRIYEPGFGNLTSLTGPNGLPTSWQYDDLGRKHLETRADGTTTQWDYYIYAGGTYAPQPNIAYYSVTANSGQANVAYDYFDKLNRKVMSSRRNFANTDWIDLGNVVYDGRGRLVKSYQPYERSNFANAQYSTVSYDLLDRIKAQTTLTENNTWVTTAVTYAGLTTIDQDPLGHTKTTNRDVLGKVASVIDTEGKAIGYTYDAFGNLLTTTDALGNVIVLSYDLRGRKIGMSDPDMGSWTYGYDVLGELVSQVDAKNQTVSMTYDKLGRITKRSEIDLVSTWTYDSAPNGKGKVATVSSNNGYSRTYSYDILGRSSSVSTVVDVATPYVTSVDYDPYGRIDTQTFPTGFKTKNVYNADGFLAQVVNATTTSTVYWTANTMDAMGHLTQQTYGNGTALTHVFYPQTGRLQRQMAGAGNAVQDTTYTYDDIGNLSQRVDVPNNLTETYLYDSLSQLQFATATSGPINTLNTYTYDIIGNIKTQSKKDVSANTYLYNYNYTYNASGPNSVGPHAVTSVLGNVYGINNPTYSYDANGNLSNGAGRTVVWNSFNMPTTMQGCPNGGTTCSNVGFWYNPEHERVKELQADKSIVIALNDGGLHFEKKYIAANGALTGAVEYEHALYAGGIMFGQYVTTTATDGVTIISTKTEYYVKDRLGSVVARLDSAGTVIERMSYDVFGKRRYPNGAADPNGLLNNPDGYRGYTGHEMLDAVGFIHMNGRIFDPTISRFLSADPIIQAPYDMQSYNRYTYGWNNPLNGTDPSGYSWLGDRWYALTGTPWTNSRGYVATVAGAVADAYGCAGYCSAAAGGYNGYQNGGGTRGALYGAIGSYLGYQVSSFFPAGEGWANLAINAGVNGAIGCAGAEASGGDCGRGFLTGAVGAVGGAYGGIGGAALAGCAAGRIGGGSCGEGAVNSVKVWAIMSAAQFMAASFKSGATDKPDEPCTSTLCRMVAANDGWTSEGDTYWGYEYQDSGTLVERKVGEPQEVFSIPIILKLPITKSEFSVDLQFATQDYGQYAVYNSVKVERFNLTFQRTGKELPGGMPRYRSIGNTSSVEKMIRLCVYETCASAPVVSWK